MAKGYSQLFGKRKAVKYKTIRAGLLADYGKAPCEKSASTLLSIMAGLRDLETICEANAIIADTLETIDEYDDI